MPLSMNIAARKTRKRMVVTEVIFDAVVIMERKGFFIKAIDVEQMHLNLISRENPEQHNNKNNGSKSNF